MHGGADMIDRHAYLKDKAAGVGLDLIKAPYSVNQDAEVYVLGGGKHWVGVSMSGLELLQNATEASIKNLMDARFNASLQTLNKFSAA